MVLKMFELHILLVISENEGYNRQVKKFEKRT